MLTPSPTRTATTYSPEERTFGPYGFDSVFPSLVAFDLDYTLWPGWMDTHHAAPLKRPSPSALNSLIDKTGKKISLYPQASKILHRLQQSHTHVAAISRTHKPDLTREALALLLVPPPKERPRERPQRMIDFFESAEIYPAESKLTHFSELQKKTDIPYSEMLFISGSPSSLTSPSSSSLSNQAVERMGVTYYHLTEKGLTAQAFEEAVKAWRRRRGWRDEDEDEYEDMDISDDDSECEEDDRRRGGGLSYERGRV